MFGAVEFDTTNISYGNLVPRFHCTVTIGVEHTFGNMPFLKWMCPQIEL